MSDIIALIGWSCYGYYLYNSHYRNTNHTNYTKHMNLKRLEILLKLFDLKEINRLIEIVKKEMKEPYIKSSLTLFQKKDVIAYCNLLLNNYFEEDFTLERRNYCLKIKSYLSSAVIEDYF